MASWLVETKFYEIEAKLNAAIDESVSYVIIGEAKPQPILDVSPFGLKFIDKTT